MSCTHSLWMFYLSYILIGFGGGGCSSVVLVKCTASWFYRDIAGLIAGFISVLSIAGRFGLGWLADLFDKRLILAATYGLTSLGLLALCFVDTRWALFLFLGLFSVGYGGSMVLRAALLRESFGRDSFGRLFGLILGAAAIGGLIGPTLAGLVFDTWRNYLFAWLGLSLSTAFAAVLMWTIASKKRPEMIM